MDNTASCSSDSTYYGHGDEEAKTRTLFGTYLTQTHMIICTKTSRDEAPINGTATAARYLDKC